MDLRQYASDIRSNSELYAEVVNACKSLLKTAPEAKPYYDYIKSRISTESIDKWDIGYFPDDDHISLLTNMIGGEALYKLRLIYDFNKPNRAHFDVIKKGLVGKHNIIFPYCDEYGNIITLAGRSILSKEKRASERIPKYKNVPFSRQMHLFGLFESKDAIEANDGVMIVEGQIDCISCHANGVLNTVALTGSDLTMHQVFLLKRKTNNFYLLLDNDAAGKDATSKILKKYSRFINIQTLELPNGYGDVDEYLAENAGCDVIRVCLKQQERVIYGKNQN